MAEYKNSIMLGIALENQKDVQGRLTTLIEGLNNQKISLDLTLKDNNILQTLEKLNGILDATKQKMGGNISLGNIDSVINTTIKDVETLSGELQKVSRTNLGDDLYKQTTTVANGIGEITKQVGVVQKIGDEFNNVGKTVNTTTMNLKEYNNALLKIEQAQSSLSNLKLVDANKVSNLSSNLNTKDIGSTNELNNLLNQVKELENEEKNLKQIQNQGYSEISNLQKEEYSIKEKLITAEGEYKYKLEESLVTNRLLQSEQNKNIQDTGLASKEKELELTNQQVKLQEQLNQAKAKQTDVSNANDLKTLQQEQELLQKQEQAYQQINVLKSNGVINTSEINKLEELVKSASSIKEINSALSSIGTSTSRESSISTLTKQIQDAQSKLEQMKQTFGTKLPSGFIESTETELNKLLADLKNVDGANFTGIKNSLNSVKSSMSETNNETKQLVNSLKETNGGFFTGINDFLGKAGLFYGIAQAVQEVTQQLKNCYEYTAFMDKAFTDISITMEITKAQFSEMASKIQEVGIASGSSSKTVMEIAKVYANANTDIDTIMSKIRPDLWLANVSRMDGSEITKTIQSVTNQFQLLTKEGMNVEQATTKIGNSMVTVSKNMAYGATRCNMKSIA